MEKRIIKFSPPDISETEIQEVAEALRSGWITTGPRTKLLERRLAAYIETGRNDVVVDSDIERWSNRVVCLNSATAAEELNLRILGVGEGDEVIVPAYTYTATASAAIHCGARVVFVDNKPKISYAASAGHSSMLGQGTIELIKQLDVISVREEELKSFLLTTINSDVRKDIDPVLLLSKEQWDRFIPSKRIVKQKYIFCYSIGDKEREITKIACDYAKKSKLKIVYVNKGEKYGLKGVNRYGSNPIEFIQLIRDSEIVIASSFHATAFSVIYHKKLLAVPCSQTGGRVTELLKTIGMEDYIYDSYEDYLKRTIGICDYSNVDKVLFENKNESIDFLRSEFS